MNIYIYIYTYTYIERDIHIYIYIFVPAFLLIAIIVGHVRGKLTQIWPSRKVHYDICLVF